MRASIGIVGGSSPSDGRVGCQRVAVLRPPDLTAGVGGDLEQPDLAHPVEVRAHGVRVEAEPLGDLRRDERARRAGQLQVDGVAGVVAQHPQHVTRRQRSRQRVASRRNLHGDQITRSRPVKSAS